MRGDLPELTLFIVDKDNKKHKTVAGAAWSNDFGGYALKLNPGIVLKWDDEVYLNLNPRMTRAEYVRMERERTERVLDESDLSYYENLSEEEEVCDEPELGEETRSD